MAQDSCILSLSYLTGSVPASERKTWHPQRSWTSSFAKMSFLWKALFYFLKQFLSCSSFSLTDLLMLQGEKWTQGRLWRHKHYLGLKSPKEFTEFFNLAIIPLYLWHFRAKPNSEWRIHTFISHLLFNFVIRNNKEEEMRKCYSSSLVPWTIFSDFCHNKFLFLKTQMWSLYHFFAFFLKSWKLAFYLEPK